VQKKKVCSNNKESIKQIELFLVYESVRHRESIFHTIGQSSADLESQGKASEYALRKRLNELERSLKELEWQKKQVFFNPYPFILLIIFYYYSRQKKKFLVMKMILIV